MSRKRRQKGIRIVIQTASGQKKTVTYRSRAELREHISHDFGQTYLSSPDWSMMELLGEKMPKAEATSYILQTKRFRKRTGRG